MWVDWRIILYSVLFLKYKKLKIDLRERSVEIDNYWIKIRAFN